MCKLKAAILLTLTGVVLSAPPLVPEHPSSTTTSTTTLAPTTTTTATVPSTVKSFDTHQFDNSLNQFESFAAVTRHEILSPTTTTSTTTTTPTSTTTERLDADTRRYLLQGVPSVDFDQLGKLNLTPKQRLALQQEFQLQKLGLPSFTDPTPWQRLSRDEQLEFNRKYLALPPELQEYSRNQFLSLPDRRQEKAYNTFIREDIKTLTRAIQREYDRERLALERRTEQERHEEDTKIQQLLDQKRMQYSAMNAQIVTDILDNNIDNEGSDLIKLLKQQLSNSLQVAQDEFDESIDENSDNTADDNDDDLVDVIIVTTPHPLPEPEQEKPRSQSNSTKPIKFHRLNDINTDDEYLKSVPIKTSPRVPKSNSRILSARAALFARRFEKYQHKVSAAQKRNNIQRLMYDPRKKL